MRRSYKDGGMDCTNEMTVVDTFTRLIFGDSDFSDGEIEIIETLRVVNPDVWCDTYPQMGEYLRNLGVREMIQLVLRVREQMAKDTHRSVTGGATTEVSGSPISRK
ncbi:hypothetical protein [Candidatus Marimicrobium litorale]|uniref:CdiI immunity protein domain-containing protein n=1 Tax=Candidatus Marimicrobium litorale TaxID=2518991 RepID=A0ABT3T9M4_9GAMM|nr:hypothetical protein [Candidatus Marimicrobium litorale]MCX2978967.1 hypothetical protein [Candidatus Marimicrobium litorale]